jgi:hypothetical protein
MYKTQELEVNGVPRLGIVLDKYPDTVFVVGAIEFIEQQDELKLSYKYDIIEGTNPTHVREFETDIGNFIYTYILDHPQELVFHGGL